MSGYRVEICGRAYEGDYRSLPDAVYGALLKDRNATSELRRKVKLVHGADCPNGGVRYAYGCRCACAHNYRIAIKRIDAEHQQHTIQVDTVPNVSPKKIHRVP